MSLYDDVPKDVDENLEYRIDLAEWAKGSKARQELIIENCQKDTLYFFSSFLYLFEPRPGVADDDARILPFIPWPHQEKLIRKVEPALGRRDIGIEKARGEGASWCFLMLLLKKWLWSSRYAIGMVCRNEDAVDDPRDPGSLGWKIDFALSMLPKWMMPAFERSQTKHTWYNKENDSYFAGYTATGEVGSGARFTVFLFDELSKFTRGNDYDAVTATQQSTECRIFIATPNGPRGAYYDIMHEESNLLKVQLKWEQNPTRNVGMYKSEKEQLIRLDEFKGLVRDPKSADPDKYVLYPDEYPFVLDGWTRSPWFDVECNRPKATRRAIMQELMLHYGGSDDPYFDPELLQKLNVNCREPLYKGRLKFDPDDHTPHWEPRDEGKLHVWCAIDQYNNPPPGYYTVGCDVAGGTGGEFSSNSVACVLDTKTGEQVAEFAVNDTSFPPDVFAEWCIALCKWFHGAFLNWEANGPGGVFTRKILDKGYPNIYFRETKETNIRKKTRKAGFWSQANDRADLLGGHVRGGGFEEGVRSGGLVIRSTPLLKECSYFVYDNGKVIHRRSKEAQDESSRGEAHGDRVIAAAIAWLSREERPAPKVEVDTSCPPGSFGWRREQARRQSQQTGLWSR